LAIAQKGPQIKTKVKREGNSREKKGRINVQKEDSGGVPHHALSPLAGKWARSQAAKRKGGPQRGTKEEV